MSEGHDSGTDQQRHPFRTVVFWVGLIIAVVSLSPIYKDWIFYPGLVLMAYALVRSETGYSITGVINRG